MCDVPNIAIFFKECIECFPGISSKFLLKLFLLLLLLLLLIIIVVVVEGNGKLD